MDKPRLSVTHSQCDARPMVTSQPKLVLVLNMPTHRDGQAVVQMVNGHSVFASVSSVTIV